MALFNNQPYTRNIGTDSGLGSTQTRHCPSGYRWNIIQRKCVPTMLTRLGGNQGTNPTTAPSPTTTPTPATTPKVGSSDIAKLLATAIDLKPTWNGDTDRITLSAQTTGGEECPEGQRKNFMGQCVNTWQTNRDERFGEGGTIDRRAQQRLDYQDCLAKKGNVLGARQACWYQIYGAGAPDTDNEETPGITNLTPYQQYQQCIARGGTDQSCADEQNYIIPDKNNSNGNTGYDTNPETGQTYANQRAWCISMYDQGWSWVSAGNPLNPDEGQCVPPTYERNPQEDWTGAGNVIGETPTTIDPETLQVDERPIDIGSLLDPSAYEGIKALTGGVFDGKTLQELEDERIAAAEDDYNRTYGYAADDLTKRLNEQAAAGGMFHSGSRQGLMGRELNRLDEERRTKLGQAQAEIRGERPELLLQEQEAQRKAWDTWANYDLATKQNLVSSMLQGREQEYKRMFDNGTLTLSAFDGNVGLMRMYLDFILSSARDEREQNESATKIAQIINAMNDEAADGILSIFM